MQPLQDKLDAFKKDFEAKVPQAALEVMHRATDELNNSGILDNTVKVGDTLPEFSLENQDGVLINSRDLLNKGPLVISFFRGSWCPYCNLELAALGEAYQSFKDLGADMVVISPQNKQFALEAKKNNTLGCEVLIDTNNDYATTLGTSFTLPAYLKELYQSFGVDLPKHNSNDSWALPMPLRAVVDPQGVIQYLDINPDYTQRPEISACIESINAIKQS